MKHRLNLDTWNRKEHYGFFKQFDQPYYGVNVTVDCSIAYKKSKQLGVPFYNYYLHKCLLVINEIENFKLRIEDEEVWLYDVINASCTVLREDKTFGFSYMKFDPDFEVFNTIACEEIARVKQTNGLFTAEPLPNIIHFSALPWVNFTSITQASHSKFADSCPKFSIGKVYEESGKKLFSIAVHVHHALIDGYHLGLFYDRLQLLMNEE